MPFLVKDDRVHPGLEPRVVELQLAKRAAGTPIFRKVAYQQVEHSVSDDGHNAVVADDVVLVEGVSEP